MNPKKLSFEAPLSTGKPNREPGRPANIDNDYTFAGWYLDPGFTTKGRLEFKNACGRRYNLCQVGDS